MSNKIEIRVSLEENFKEKIKVIKEYYGLKNKTELIRFLITDKYRDISHENLRNDG